MTAEDDLAKIVNIGQEVTLMGEKLRIRELTLGPATRIMPHLGPLAYIFRRVFEKPKDSKGRPLISEAEILEIVIEACSISGESIMGIISVVSGKTPEQLEGANLIESAKVLGAVVTQNIPLFSKENIGELKDVWAKVEAGMSSSTNSSNGATGPKKRSSKATPSPT